MFGGTRAFLKGSCLCYWGYFTSFVSAQIYAIVLCNLHPPGLSVLLLTPAFESEWHTAAATQSHSVVRLVLK